MKRLITVVIIGLVMFSCGIFRKSTSPVSETNPVMKGIEQVDEMVDEEEIEIRHLNAFDKEDLYQSRENKLKRMRRRPSPEQIVEKDAISQNDTISKKEKKMVEIIQVVDDTGNVVASKKVE